MLLEHVLTLVTLKTKCDSQYQQLHILQHPVLGSMSARSVRDKKNQATSEKVRRCCVYKNRTVVLYFFFFHPNNKNKKFVKNDYFCRVNIKIDIILYKITYAQLFLMRKSKVIDFHEEISILSTQVLCSVLSSIINQFMLKKTMQIQQLSYQSL